MVKKIPHWLESHLSLEDAHRIEEAVQNAERKTSGEIVPMLVYRSTIGSHTALLGALISLLLGLCLQKGLLLAGMPSVHELLWDLGLLLWTALGYGLSHLPSVQRHLIPRRDQKLEVHRRALLAFYEAGLAHTASKTGILLYLSFFEREAVVLFDKGIAQHCDKATFDAVCKELIAGVRQKNLAGGFERAIAICHRLLEPHFPPAAHNPNELKDYLRISF